MVTPEAQRVFDIVQQIPAGKVATYKQIAQLAGLKNPRHVGKILHQNPSPDIYPCHRVVRSDGTVADGYAFGERFAQIALLRQEGVVFLGGKTDILHFKWDNTKN
jgi:methylated-DNA-protein-cysteine methyltransferase-like protein